MFTKEPANSSALSYDIDEIGFGVPQIFCGLLFLVLTALFFMDSKVSKRERNGMALLLGVLLVSFCFNILNPFRLQEDIYQRVSGIDVSVFKNAIMYIPINSTVDIHYIDLQYSPVGFNLGLILSVISLGIILILILKNIGVVDENKG